MFIKSDPKQERPKSENKKITACKDCGGMVSKKAASCPHCGARIRVSEVNQLATIIMALILLGIILAIFLPLIGIATR
ncbi:MAG TPA: hypothetical protein VK717_02525 [Opitutaceae bacterium]|jgi:uncharacterized paraquat-inducible protein A|nr:hypothetical protein [Opitutaceae bacterium]